MAKVNHTSYCIYRIVCAVTLKSYVGLTSDPKKREYEHFRELALGCHFNPHLQRAFRVYGRDAFSFEIVEQNISSSDIDSRECHWIEYFNSCKNGYNIAPGGGLSYRGKPCVWNGAEYENITLAALANGVDRATMCERLTNGYTCDADLIAPGEQRNKSCLWNGIQYPSQKAAAKALGISKGAMKFRVQSGYTCDEDMPQRTPCVWDDVKYKSLSECSRSTGIPITSLNRWIVAGATRESEVVNRMPQRKRNT